MAPWPTIYHGRRSRQSRRNRTSRATIHLTSVGAEAAAGLAGEHCLAFACQGGYRGAIGTSVANRLVKGNE
jgi:hypothetical protein